MNDKDLEHLKNIPCPAPDADRQAQALAAGLQAFRAAQSAQTSAGAVKSAEPAALQKANEKNQKNFQGFFDFLRPIGTIHQRVGSFIMKKQLIVSTAVASVFAVTLAVHHHWWGMPTQGDAPKMLPKTAPAERRAEAAIKTEVETVKAIEKGELSHAVQQQDRTSTAPGGLPTLSESKLEKQAAPQPNHVSELMSSSDMAESEPVSNSLAVVSSQPAPETRTKSPAKKSGEHVILMDQNHSVIMVPEESDSSASMASGALANRRQLAPKAQAQLSDARIGVRPHPLPRPYPLPQPSLDRQAGDQFEAFENNPLVSVSEQPVSTFSIDVDTASYAYMRRSLNQGRLPQRDSVRVEELINYFDYDYPVPASAKKPFLPTVSIYPTPWNAETKLMHIGIKGHDIVAESKKPSNLVFLIDVSGSMSQADKLPLLINAFKLLVNTLSETDRVAIVTYAGQAGTVLDSTPVSKKSEILAALENLRAGGSTAGAQGIAQAYALAKDNFMPDGVNRVILATDGDFNVGISNPKALREFIEEKRNAGIYLSVLGFGQGNYQDAAMQSLAQAGNGNAAYIDSLSEAQKVLVDEASSTLFPIANDVKIQIEFNPAQVAEYRLIGYETRALKREDFNNDKVDAGDIGAGHAVTAIYEITPVGSVAQMNDPLRYQPSKAPVSDVAPKSNEYAFLKLRYKLPGASTSELLSLPLGPQLLFESVEKLPNDQRFAAAVAAFGQKLRGEGLLTDYTFDQIIALANGAKGTDPYGYRAEFVKLVRLAQSLKAQN